MRLSNMNILVVGASGFIGSRLCERLYLEHDVGLTALVRNIGKASRIGRMRINIVKGDVFDRQLVDRLMQDVDVVVSLLAGNQRSIIKGTHELLESALKANLKRFIHMSSAAVYGLKPKPEHANESAPLKKTGNPYSDAKIKAERLVERFQQKGLKTVMLRPRIVWGPYSSWVTSFYKQAQNGTFYLVNEGAGACNTVYIDNLIDAVFLSIYRPEAVGQVYFVTDDHLLTWGQFYQAWADVFGRTVCFESVDAGESDLEKKQSLLRDIKRFVLSATFRRFFREMPLVNLPVNRLLSHYYALAPDAKMRLKNLLGIQAGLVAQNHGSQPLVPVDRLVRESGSGFADISKIKRELNYSPSVTLSAGIDLTKQWIEASGFLGICSSRDL